MRSSLSLLLLLSLAGCPSTPATDGGVTPDVPAVDAPVSLDTPATVDAPADDAPVAVDAPTDAPPDAPLPEGFIPLPNCRLPSDYVMAGASPATSIVGFTYDPPCLTVTAGTTVSMAAEGFHPLVPSTMGTAGNPIPAGVTVATDVTFEEVGFFPYFCANHGSMLGGMAGVIQVVAP